MRWSRRRLYGCLGAAFLVITGAGLLAGTAMGRWLARQAVERTVEVTLHPKPDLDAAAARVSAAASRPLALPLADPRIVILKGARRAELYSGTHLVRTYPIVLGPDPVGHKARKGDGRTPEGTYYICTRNSRSQYHLFLGLNFPRAADAQAGLKAGLVNEAQAQACAAAEQARQRPPWDTRLGGAIGLHGGGLHHDWTAGCIAFDNAAIEEIWQASTVWTPVEIRP